MISRVLVKVYSDDFCELEILYFKNTRELNNFKIAMREECADLGVKINFFKTRKLAFKYINRVETRIKYRKIIESFFNKSALYIVASIFIFVIYKMFGA